MPGVLCVKSGLQLACLVLEQVFILNNAKVSATDPAEHAQSYVLASGAEDVNFKEDLNHEVTITGSTMPLKSGEPGGKKVKAKDLPKLTAKSLAIVSDRCPSTRETRTLQRSTPASPV
jgi:hypothetical protein